MQISYTYIYQIQCIWLNVFEPQCGSPTASQNMFHQIKIKQLYETIYLLHTNIFACFFVCLPVLLHQPDCLICPETKLEDHIIYIRLSSPLFLSVLRWSLLHPWVLDMTVYLNQLPAETSHTHTHCTSDHSDEVTPSWWIWGISDKMAAVGLLWFSWISWSTSWVPTDSGSAALKPQIALKTAKLPPVKVLRGTVWCFE